MIIRTWIELVLFVAFIAVVILSAPSVFGKQRMGNYRMSDFDDDDKPGNLP